MATLERLQQYALERSQRASEDSAPSSRKYPPDFLEAQGALSCSLEGLKLVHSKLWEVLALSGKMLPKPLWYYCQEAS